MSELDRLLGYATASSNWTGRAAHITARIAVANGNRDTLAACARSGDRTARDIIATSEEPLAEEFARNPGLDPDEIAAVADGLIAADNLDTGGATPAVTIAVLERLFRAEHPDQHAHAYELCTDTQRSAQIHAAAIDALQRSGETGVAIDAAITVLDQTRSSHANAVLDMISADTLGMLADLTDTQRSRLRLNTTTIDALLERADRELDTERARQLHATFRPPSRNRRRILAEHLELARTATTDEALDDLRAKLQRDSGTLTPADIAAVVVTVYANTDPTADWSARNQFDDFPNDNAITDAIGAAVAATDDPKLVARLVSGHNDALALIAASGADELDVLAELRQHNPGDAGYLFGPHLKGDDREHAQRILAALPVSALSALPAEATVRTLDELLDSDDNLWATLVALTPDEPGDLTVRDLIANVNTLHQS